MSKADAAAQRRLLSPRNERVEKHDKDNNREHNSTADKSTTNTEESKKKKGKGAAKGAPPITLIVKPD